MEFLHFLKLRHLKICLFYNFIQIMQKKKKKEKSGKSSACFGLAGFGRLRTAGKLLGLLLYYCYCTAKLSEQGITFKPFHYQHQFSATTDRKLLKVQ